MSAWNPLERPMHLTAICRLPKARPSPRTPTRWQSPARGPCRRPRRAQHPSIVNNSWLTLDQLEAIRALFHFRLARGSRGMKVFLWGVLFCWRAAGGMVSRDETQTSPNLGCGWAHARARASAASLQQIYESPNCHPNTCLGHCWYCTRGLSSAMDHGCATLRRLPLSAGRRWGRWGRRWSLR